MRSQSHGMTASMTHAIPSRAAGRPSRPSRARGGGGGAARSLSRKRTRQRAAAADDAYNAAMKAYSATPYEYKHELGLCACSRRCEAMRRRLN